MIDNEIIEQRLRENKDIELVKVESDGYHYHLIVVSDVFVGKPTVARQRWVYSQLKDYITSGSLHALSMKTWTIDEWEQKRG